VRSGEAGRLSDARLEWALLAPSPDQIYGLVLRCAKDDAIALATRDLPPGLSRLPMGLTGCAGKRLAAAPDPELIRILVDHDRTGTVDALVACDRAAVLAAYRKELASPPVSMPTRRADCVIRSLSGLPAGGPRPGIHGRGHRGTCGQWPAQQAGIDSLRPIRKGGSPRMHRRFLVPLALLAAAPFLLAACGGDDSSQDEDDITAAIEQAGTSDEASKCTELQTQAFTEQTEFASGEEAITTCEENAGDGDVAGESVEVSNVEVDGDTATAEADFSGGGLDGQTLTISLVKEGDQWKLDSLDEFVDFDKDSFASGLLEGASADGDVPQAVLDSVEQAGADTPEEDDEEM
jgi:hypothetical protein